MKRSIAFCWKIKKKINNKLLVSLSVLVGMHYCSLLVNKFKLQQW